MTTESPKAPSSDIRVESLTLGYGRRVVLDNITLDIPEGSITAVYGHNGAGKTTLLHGIAGFLRPVSGSVFLGRENVTPLRAAERTRRGLRYVPQTHGVFPDLTVRENLQVSTTGSAEALDRALEIFPELGQKMSAKAGTLSGGQRQMLAISMALVGEPTALLLDEPSTGLAPVLVDQVLDSLEVLHQDSGMTIVVVEQNIAKTQRLATHALVVQMGEIVFAGSTRELDDHPDAMSLL